MSQFRAAALLDTFTSSICLEKVCKYQDIKKPRKCGAFFWRLLAFKWGGRWGSNPRQPESQSGTLPTELRPPLIVSAELLFASILPVKCLDILARPAGLEPATLGLEGRCSIRMSYGRLNQVPHITGKFQFRQNMVGVERFELPTSCSQSRRATRLRYTPGYH